MEIFKVTLIGCNDTELQTTLFDNFDSAKDFFNEFIQSLKEGFLEGSCKLDFRKLESINGKFEEVEWIETEMF